VKRVVDVLASGLGLVVLSPLLALVTFAVWLEDRHSPFYIAHRVGRGGTPFRMIKLRSMVVDADRTGVDSTAGDDPRITRVGRYIRAFKLDELSQLWNVLKGDMSLVGPRPNVERDVRLYTAEERHLLDVRPGITDFASIVFADESDILEGAADPDLEYNRVIRPWKSRMGLLYVDRRSMGTDLRLIRATLVNAVDRRRALDAVASMLEDVGADGRLVRVARREEPLEAAPPPGATEIVKSRETTD
jgi:lipopolysaccharide/colanic/teichoic acid biosynthesis glycosyltransferase